MCYVLYVHNLVYMLLCHIPSEFCGVEAKYILSLYREVFLHFFLIYQNIFLQVRIIMFTYLGKVAVSCAVVIVPLRRAAAASSLTWPCSVLSSHVRGLFQNQPPIGW